MLKLVFILLLVFIISEASTTKVLVNEKLNDEWTQFKIQFNKKYENSLKEMTRRLIWQENVEAIQKHNIEYDLGKQSYSMGMNQFTDLTNEEFTKLYLGYNAEYASNTTDSVVFTEPLNMASYPSTVDWRTKGFVTPVKNQGQCGSCWSFSTTGSLEGQYKRKTGRLLSFSEQQLVDCTRNYGNFGCSGGYMNNAFKYIHQFGIEREADYPYIGKNMLCRYNANRVVTRLNSFINIKKGDELDLMKAVATVGPVAVAIDASHHSFQMYRGGIYYEPTCSQTRLSHAVLVVGYGTYQGYPYWLVKNSWSTRWGMNGYIMMLRNRNNMCGITSMASYPVM